MSDDLAVRRVAVESLAPDPENVRLHGDGNLAAIRASLQEFGQRRPLLVTRAGVVVAGDGTLEAARELGWSEVAVTVLPWDDPARCRAYALVDNRAAELAEWDERELLGQLRALQANGWAADAVGWAAEQVADLEALWSDVPPVEELARRAGEPSAKALWPVLRLHLPPEVMARWQRWRVLVPGEDEAARFAALLALAGIEDGEGAGDD